MVDPFWQTFGGEKVGRMGEERGVQKSEKIFFAFLDELDHSKHFLKNQLKSVKNDFWKARCEKIHTFFLYFAPFPKWYTYDRVGFAQTKWPRLN